MFIRFILSIILDYFSCFIVSRREKPVLCIYENTNGGYLPVNNRSLIGALVFDVLKFRYTSSFLPPPPSLVPENGLLGGILFSVCPSFRLSVQVLLCN